MGEQKCIDKPNEICQNIPREQCHNEHKKIPLRVSRKVPKQVCIHTDGYDERKPVHPHPAVIPVQPSLDKFQGVVTPPIIPTPVPDVPILPNAVPRSAKLIKEEAKPSSEEEIANDLGRGRDKEDDSSLEKTNDAIVFKE